MTAKQIEKKLAVAGIETAGLEIVKDEVTVCVGYSERNGRGTCNERKTNALKNKVAKTLGWGGFSTQYGAWILHPNYQPLGDWNDKGSRHHY